MKFYVYFQTFPKHQLVKMQKSYFTLYTSNISHSVCIKLTLKPTVLNNSSIPVVQTRFDSDCSQMFWPLDVLQLLYVGDQLLRQSELHRYVHAALQEEAQTFT